MKFILAANTMEHPAFSTFVRDAATDHPEAAFIICGDLLNVFPEPGEDLRSSIFYEIYGDILVEELERLRADHFTTVSSSPIIGPLREIFCEDGRTYQQGLALASRRYAR